MIDVDIDDVLSVEGYVDEIWSRHDYSLCVTVGPVKHSEEIVRRSTDSSSPRHSGIVRLRHDG